MKTYTELRSQVKDGDILFLAPDPKSLFSRLIGLMTGGRYSHAAILFWYQNRLLVVESSEHGGVRVVNASIYKDRLMDFVPAPKLWQDISDKALENIQTSPYSYPEAVYIGVREFLYLHTGLRLPGKKKSGRLVCSEFVAQVLGFDDIEISPQTLYNKLTQKA